VRLISAPSDPTHIDGPAHYQRLILYR
jgi:hypothetical protein